MATPFAWLVALAGLLLAVPAANAHIVKVDGGDCDGPGYWVDKTPDPVDMIGNDPSAVVVLHPCGWCSGSLCDLLCPPTWLHQTAWGCGSHP